MNVQFAVPNKQIVPPDSSGGNKGLSDSKLSPELERTLLEIETEFNKRITDDKKKLFEAVLEQSTAADAENLAKEAKAKTEEEPVKTGIDYVNEFLLERNMDGVADFITKLGDANNPMRKKAGTWINMLAAGSNLICESPFFKNSKVASVIGDLSYRAFLLLNFSIGAITGLKQNRGIMLLGNVVDFPVAFLPRKWIYAARRPYAGLMVLSNAFLKSTKSHLKPKGKKPFAKMQDSFTVAIERIKALPSELFNDIMKILKDTKLNTSEKGKEFLTKVLFNTVKSTMGIIGGFSCLLGSAMHLMGMHKAGQFVGDLVGTMGFSAERVNLQNLDKGRLYYWLSGIFLAGGGLSDFSKNTRLQMSFDALSKIATQECNRLHEVQEDKEAIPSPFKNPPKFLFTLLKNLNESFLFKKAEPAAA